MIDKRRNTGLYRETIDYQDEVSDNFLKGVDPMNTGLKLYEVLISDMDTASGAEKRYVHAGNKEIVEDYFKHLVNKNSRIYINEKPISKITNDTIELLDKYIDQYHDKVNERNILNKQIEDIVDNILSIDPDLIGEIIMKIRTGFVSNSSSSSFVVIDMNPENLLEVSPPEAWVPFGHGGFSEFGWSPEMIQDWRSRINFAYIQCHGGYIGDDPNQERLDLLKDVIADYFEMDKHNINFCVTGDWDNKDEYLQHGYIDHQSAGCEGKNLEIFDNYNTLKQFIFGRGSKIVLNNDNH